MAGSFSENVTTGERLTMTMPDGSERNVTVVGVVNGTRGEAPVSEFARQPRVSSERRRYSPSSRARRRVCGNARTRR